MKKLKCKEFKLLVQGLISGRARIQTHVYLILELGLLTSVLNFIAFVIRNTHTHKKYLF